MDGEIVFELVKTPALKADGYGPHVTCWTPARANESIPYRSIDIRKDGTFTATIDASALDPEAGAPATTTVQGVWAHEATSVRSARTHALTWRESVQLIENADSKWALPDQEAKAHVFNFWMKPTANGGYSALWNRFGGRALPVFVPGSSTDVCSGNAPQ